MRQIAIIVPTIRNECWKEWYGAWRGLLIKHQAWMVKVDDGASQKVTIARPGYSPSPTPQTYRTAKLLGNDADLISSYTPACRNLGLYAVAKLLPDVDTILTFDDDTLPHGDTIQDHLDILDKRVPTSWITTAEPYMRGFPWEIRDEAPVMISHGCWTEVPDLDAPTQLVCGSKVQTEFYVGPIPKGIFAPICGMNVAFRREVLPHLYWAPTKELPGAERFDDIWAFLFAFPHLWKQNWAVFTGGAKVVHKRASNVFKNLRQESLGIHLNETLWKELGNEVEWSKTFDEKSSEVTNFFLRYQTKRKRWEELIKAANTQGESPC